MEHDHHDPNLETDNYILEEEGGVDTNIAGPSESKESSSIKLEINQNIETTKLKNNNDDAETLEFGNNNIIETIILDKESEKNQYICKFCSQIFDKHQALGGHMNGHSKEERNLEKFGKLATWMHATYPPPLNTTLASEAKLQGTSINGATCNSYNHLVEVGNVCSQLGGQRTIQQSTQQIQLSQGLQTQQQQQQQQQQQHQYYQAQELQQQQLQYYQAQELQHYQYSQGLQSNQSTQALQNPQNYQALQRLQNYQTPQGLQNYQTPHGLQNYQASQGYQSCQTPQQFQNYQTPQEPQYYQALQGSQNYQAIQGPQYCQAPQRFQNYQTPQGPQSYQAPQGPQSYQTPQGSQSYQAPQGSQIDQASQRSQSYYTTQRSQSNQTPQEPRQQLVVDANNQENLNLNFETSNKPTSLAEIPSNEPKNNLSNSQGLHFQEKEQGPQKYMPNPQNLRHGDRLTIGPFINEKMNKEYYAQFGVNVLKKSNQRISIPQTCDTLAQYRPINFPNTSSSFNQSKDE